MIFLYKNVFNVGEGATEALTDLWNVVFGDDKSYIRRFYGDFFGTMDVAATVTDEAEVASACHFLPVSMKVGKMSMKGSYLYAAMTSPDHRGKGLMGELLKERIQRGARDGELFMCTLPAEDSLYSLYERYGLEGVFWIKRATVTREQLNSRRMSLSFDSNVSPEYVYRKTYGARELTIIKNNVFVEYTEKDNKGGNGDFLPIAGGYMYTRPREGYMYVKEIYTSEDTFPYVASLLLRKYKEFDKFVFDFCPDMVPKGIETEDLRMGSLRFLNVPAVMRLFATKDKNLNITFNVEDDLIPENSGGYTVRSGRVIWGDQIEGANTYKACELPSFIIKTTGLVPYMNMMLD